MVRTIISNLRPKRAAKPARRQREGEPARKKETYRNDQGLKGLKPGSDWRDVWDEIERGLAVRVGPKGADGRFRRTFVMVARFDGKNPSRRRLGEYPGLSLADAREKASDWRKQVAKGIDPKIEEQAIKRKRLADNANTFEPVAERYISEHLGEHTDKDGTKTYAKRRGKDDAREIRKFLVKAWGGVPVTQVMPQDIKELIKPLARRTPAQAHLVLNHVKRIFAFVLNDDIDHGVTQSPAALLSPEKLIGQRKVRTRVLSDDELRAFWKATGKLGSQAGSMYRLIALTGVRIGEAARASWPEFSFQERLWRIPSERFKSEQEHLIHLSEPTLSLLGKLPELPGEFLFSWTGKKAIGGFSKPKARLDQFMREELGEVEPFVVHDIRRTVRTRLSELKVDRNVAELVIGHGKKGLDRVYDQHEFLPEMSVALDRWADRLLEIVGEAKPKPDNVATDLDERRAKKRARRASA